MTEAYYGSDEYFALHYAEHREDQLNAVVPPIYMTSLHALNNIGEYAHLPAGRYIYGRYGNPNVDIVEQKIAALERGKRAFLYASGMAAASSAIMAVCRTGSHVICVHNAYGPVQEFLKDYCVRNLNMTVTFVHGDSTEEIRDAIRDETSMIILESPGSATFTLCDFEAVTELAKRRGIVTYTDNSYCSPEFQKPLLQGVDIVMHSVTKYLGGHSDVVGGVLVTSDDTIIRSLAKQRTWFGGIMGPMEAWLLMRGIRTLSIRMRKHAEIAQKVAEELEKNPKIRKVNYPGLPSHPQYALAQKQQLGSSGLMSFEINGTTEQAEEVINRLKVFQIGPSWGGYESLAVMPYIDHTDEYAQWCNSCRGLIRIHCGLEGADVLLQDIEQALSIL